MSSIAGPKYKVIPFGIDQFTYTPTEQWPLPNRSSVKITFDLDIVTTIYDEHDKPCDILSKLNETARQKLNSRRQTPRNDKPLVME